MKNLVIVESPAKAETIGKYLGPDYTVMSSRGHIRDLKTKGLSVDINDDFAPVYEIPAEKKELVKELKSAAKNADMVWLASDEDREGEAIAWHLYEVLGLKPENTRRIVFHEITKPAILDAIAHPREIDHDLVNAQQARRVLDRIVGFELSPVLWKKIKPALSAGRVQSVTLRLVCEREREIEAFRPEPYFRVTAIFTTPPGKEVKAELKRRFASEEEARSFLERCNGATFKVGDVTVKPLKRSPAPPFTTSTLQQEAGRRLSFPVGMTMRIAQKLYEEGRITYMRTDSTNLSELALKDMGEEIAKLYGKDYHQTRHYHTHSKGAQEAHEAIRPTYVSTREIPGSSEEKRLYDLIWKRAVASQMADAIVEKTNVDIDVIPSRDIKQVEDEVVKGEPGEFRAEGEVIKFEGFMKVYGSDKNDAEGGLLPKMEVGETLADQAITATGRFTQAPARYTEDSLVKKMEELGIGRPSTYAPTISTILSRDYIARGEKPRAPRDYKVLTLSKGEITAKTETEVPGSDKRRLVPTDVGMVVNDFLTQNFPEILDYNFTAHVETKFDDIAEGKLGWKNEISTFYDDFHPEIEKVSSMRMEHKVGERELGKDPATGRPVFVKIGRYGPVVQVGDAADEEKPLFASLDADQSIQDITLEEALKLFELPRTLGEFEGEKVKASKGRFGPYVQLGKLYVSIPKELAPQTITLDEAIALIKAKREQEANKFIKDFPEMPGLQVLNGRYGPYLAYKPEGAKKAVNYKIPKSSNPAELTLQEARKLMEEQDSAPKRKAPSRAKGKK